MYTPQDKCPFDDYSQRSLGLLIPDSGLNARNSSGVTKEMNHISPNKKSALAKSATAQDRFPLKTSPHQLRSQVPGLVYTCI